MQRTQENFLSPRKMSVSRMHSLPNDSYMFRPVRPASAPYPLEELEASQGYLELGIKNQNTWHCVLIITDLRREFFLWKVFINLSCRLYHLSPLPAMRKPFPAPGPRCSSPFPVQLPPQDSPSHALSNPQHRQDFTQTGILSLVPSVLSASLLFSNCSSRCPMFILSGGN